MTFDEWWKSFRDRVPAPPAMIGYVAAGAKDGWDAATIAERERCARLAESLFDEERMFEGRRDGGTFIAEEIRRTR
jgi:hypothetical protein